MSCYVTKCDLIMYLVFIILIKDKIKIISQLERLYTSPPFYFSQRPTQLCANSNRFVLGNGSDTTFVEGNSWQWISNAWHLKRNFDVQRDFPDISMWVTKISPASLKMCFNHNASKNHTSSIEQNESSNKIAGNGNFLDFSKLKADFPDTEHKVFI
jgi:hypothetical protein